VLEKFHDIALVQRVHVRPLTQTQLTRKFVPRECNVGADPPSPDATANVVRPVKRLILSVFEN
jgi:hypothetical protein